jgi:hypothetical protein
MSPAKRRKGEKPVAPQTLVWSEDCHIARSIRTGSGWLDAWIMQQNVNLETLAKRSRVAPERLRELLHNREVTETELEALAGPFRTDAGSLRASVELAETMASARSAQQHELQ